MKPRVFISSTYYDLKYVRESLLNFIEKKYEFEAVLFERGNIPYDFEKGVGSSCYSEVERCNMMILIVGGKYGTLDESESDLDAYLSFTQKEFKTAIKRKIPIFVFIDKSVFVEYEIYKTNRNHGKYIPVYVDDIKIFNFIEELVKLPIRKFEKIEEIEVYLTEQWTGFFYLYLENIENKQYDNLNNKLNNTLDTVEKLKNIIDEMAKKTLDETEMHKLRNQEIEMDLKSYAEKIAESLIFHNIPCSSDFNSFCMLFVDTFCNEKELNAFNDTSINRFSYFEQLIEKFNNKVATSMKIKTIDFDKLFKNNSYAIQLIHDTENGKQLFIDCLKKSIEILGE